MAITKRLKNVSGSDLFILTRTVPNNNYYDVPISLWDHVLSDDDLLGLISSGDVLVNDGTSDLTSSEGLTHLRKFQITNSVVDTMYQLNFIKNGSSQNRFLHVAVNLPSNTTFNIIPFKSELKCITFSNANSGVDTDVEIWKSALNNGPNETQVFNWQLRDVRIARTSNFSSPITFEPGDKVAVFLDDEGTNSNNAMVTLYLQILEENSNEDIENFSGTF